jgi:hypothetical protein
MDCAQHWKSARVLPTFRTHPLAPDPPFSGDARPETLRATHLELPAWMK